MPPSSPDCSGSHLWTRWMWPRLLHATYNLVWDSVRNHTHKGAMVNCHKHCRVREWDLRTAVDTWFNLGLTESRRSAQCQASFWTSTANVVHTAQQSSLRCLPERKENVRLHKNLYTSVHSIFCNHQRRKVQRPSEEKILVEVGSVIKSHKFQCYWHFLPTPTCCSN